MRLFVSKEDMVDVLASPIAALPASARHLLERRPATSLPITCMTKVAAASVMQVRPLAFVACGGV